MALTSRQTKYGLHGKPQSISHERIAPPQVPTSSVVSDRGVSSAEAPQVATVATPHVATDNRHASLSPESSGDRARHEKVQIIPDSNGSGSVPVTSFSSDTTRPNREFVSVHSGTRAASETASVKVPSSYVVPIASTDYVGLEKIDPRLTDRVWRLNNLYTVINEQGELVRFKLRPAQMQLMSKLHYKNILLKARQLGFTTFICIFLLDYALFNRNKMVGILAHTQTDAAVIFRKVKVAWDNFPAELKKYFGLEAIGDSKSEYEFTNGSFMRIATSLRSGTYQAVLITEYAKVCARFPEKAEEIKTGTLPAVPAKGLVFIESTAEGEGGEYYDMVQDARELRRNRVPLTEKDYKFFFFPWFQNPSNKVEGEGVPIDAQTNEYLDSIEQKLKIVLSQAQRNWYYLEQKVQKGKMKQEHPSTPDEAFLSTGNKLFDAQVIEAQREKYARSALETQGDLLIYRRYIKGHVYGLAGDVSQGVRRDSSTMAVIDFTTGELCATYKSNTIDPVSFAYEMKKVGALFGVCIAAPESNGVGFTTCVTLNQIYPNVYTQVREGLLEDHPTQKLGWLSTGATKPKMMYELSEAMADDELKIYDEGVLIEAKAVTKEDSLIVQVNENTTRHFDKLTAVAICWQLRSHAKRGLESEERVAEIQSRRQQHLTRQKGSYR